MAKSNVGKILTNKKLTLGTALGVGLNAYGTISDYKQNRLEGKGKLSSGISAVGNAVMFEAIGLPKMLALGAIKYGPGMAIDGVMKLNQVARSMDRSARNVPFINSTFVDSKQAYTMRQAGMQLAQASKYNLQQSMLGNEASVMHKL